MCNEHWQFKKQKQQQQQQQQQQKSHNPEWSWEIYFLRNVPLKTTKFDMG